MSLSHRENKSYLPRGYVLDSMSLDQFTRYLFDQWGRGDSWPNSEFSAMIKTLDENFTRTLIALGFTRDDVCCHKACSECDICGCMEWWIQWCNEHEERMMCHHNQIKENCEQCKENEAKDREARKRPRSPFDLRDDWSS